MKSEITLPTEMLERFIADNEKDLADAIENGNKTMATFHEARISVYRNLLDIWAK